MPAPPPLLRTALLLGAALVAALAAAALRHSPTALAIWWPAAGFFAAALVLSPRRWWPGIAVVIALISMGSHVVFGGSPTSGVTLTLGNLSEALVVAALLGGWDGRRDTTLTEVHDYFRLLLAATVGALVMGGVSSLGALVVNQDDWWVVRTVTPGHLAGTLVVLPLLLLGRSARRTDVSVVERVVQPLALVLTLVIALAFGETLAPVLLPLPLLVWVALRLSPLAAALQVALVAVCATASASLGVGPISVLADYIAQQSGDPNLAEMLAAANAQGYVLCIALLAVPTALVSRQRTALVERLDAERELSATTLSTTAAVIFVTDPRGVVTQVNPALTRLTGFTERDALGELLWETGIIPPERVALVRSYFTAEPLAVPRIVEADVMTTSGDRRRVVWSNNVGRDPQGRILHVVLTATDVTSERTTLELVQHLFGSPNAAPMLSLDPSYTVTLCNRASADLLGLDAAEVVDRPFTELMCPYERAEFLEGLHRAASSSRESQEATALPHEWTWHRPDGTVVHLAAAVSAVLDAVGKHVGYLLVASDVTDKRASQDALVRALETERQAVQRLRAIDEAKSDFVSTVSHELRTPTTSIVGYTELLREGDAGAVTDEQEALLAAIARNGTRLISVANDLLTLAGLESQDAASAVEDRVALDRVVMHAREAIGPLLERRRLDVVVEVPDDEVVVLGDADHLDRVVVNLLSNAVKFTPDGGRVACRLRCDGEETVLEVSDTGIGVPEDEQAELFSKFFRSSTAQAQAIQGAGLGLSIVQRIVAEHDGRIEVASVLDQGTTFTVTLPLAGAVDVPGVVPVDGGPQPRTAELSGG